MIKKIIAFTILTTTILNAYTFTEFQSDCKDVGVQTGYSQNKNISKAIKEATKNAGAELAKVFHGSTINTLTKTMMIENSANDELFIKETIKDYTSEKSSGNIFYKRVRAYDGGTKEYKQTNDLIEVSAKLTCNRKMYDAIYDAILKKAFSKEKVCVIAKNSDDFSNIAIDEINEYLLSKQKNIKLYRCNTNNKDKLKKDNFTKIFIIDKLQNKKIKTDIGFQLITKLTTSFENLSNNQLYGMIKLKKSKFTQATDDDIINELYEVNLKNIIQENVKNLLLQIANKKGRK